MPTPRGSAPWILVSLLAVGCSASANPAVDLAAEEAAIRVVDQRMLEAAQGNDPSTFAASFTEDGQMLFPYEPAVQGRAAIRARAGQDFAMPGFTIAWRPTHLTVSQAGDVAVSIGTYDVALTTPGGPVEDHGKFMTFWQKVDGEWKVAADMLNTSMPMPGH